MSRVAKNPIFLPDGVKVTINGQHVVVEGSKGKLERHLHQSVKINQKDGKLIFAPYETAEVRTGWMFAGTSRALVNNMVIGVNQGYERKLLLVGVGYRAAMQGKTLNLTLGFSHPVNFAVPEGVTIETPAQTEVVVKGIDKHLVNQVAAKIRDYRRPEPYKGKGIRYSDERIVLKDVKKK